MLLLIPVFSVAASTHDFESPTTPIICGSCHANYGEPCTYSICSTDRQGDNVFYDIRYSDGPPIVNNIIGPFKSGENITIAHCWCQYYPSNVCQLKVKAIDIHGHESDWAYFGVNISNNKINNLMTFLQNLNKINLLEWIYSRLFN